MQEKKPEEEEEEVEFADMDPDELPNLVDAAKVPWRLVTKREGRGRI
jgi:hypothetical protein